MGPRPFRQALGAARDGLKALALAGGAMARAGAAEALTHSSGAASPDMATQVAFFEKPLIQQQRPASGAAGGGLLLTDDGSPSLPHRGPQGTNRRGLDVPGLDPGSRGTIKKAGAMTQTFVSFPCSQ
ncbi:Unconventional Myosin-Xvi [Manis pentadactyla]|nr:Unconventional Myosin-Xvi [Manis pentadactyla]